MMEQGSEMQEATAPAASDDAPSLNGSAAGDEDVAVSRRGQSSPQVAAGGGAVYTLGMLGALIFLWPRANGPRERTTAVMKAAFWPAILVYRAFQFISGD